MTREESVYYRWAKMLFPNLEVEKDSPKEDNEGCPSTGEPLRNTWNLFPPAENETTFFGLQLESVSFHVHDPSIPQIGAITMGTYVKFEFWTDERSAIPYLPLRGSSTARLVSSFAQETPTLMDLAGVVPAAIGRIGEKWTAGITSLARTLIPGGTKETATSSVAPVMLLGAESLKKWQPTSTTNTEAAQRQYLNQKREYDRALREMESKSKSSTTRRK